ncbi:MAG: guanylate kinase [Bacillota bacterium]
MVARGMLVVVSGPSGVGKGTINRGVLELEPNVRFSVSATTRPRRPDEVDGQHYYFISRAEFERRRAAGEFLEWTEYVGNLYGTLRSQVEEVRSAGCDCLLEIEVQGARNVREQVPDAVLIFIAPPSLAALEERINLRGCDSEEEMRSRLEVARRELAELPYYDYVVINDDRNEAVGRVRAILQAERLRTDRVAAGLLRGINRGEGVDECQ